MKFVEKNGGKNQMLNAITKIRQGDVIIYEINEFPKGERLTDKQCNECILAYGELSNHAHQFDDNTSVELFKIMGGLFMNVKKDSVLRHGLYDKTKPESDSDHHNEITIPKGKYHIGIVQETDHIEKVSRRVID